MRYGRQMMDDRKYGWFCSNKSYNCEKRDQEGSISCFRLVRDNINFQPKNSIILHLENSRLTMLFSATVPMLYRLGGYEQKHLLAYNIVQLKRHFRQILINQWVLAARARPCAARTRLFDGCLPKRPPQTGRCAPPPLPIAGSQLRCFSFDPKNI